MISRVIEFSVRNRWLVILAWAGVAAWGVYALLHTPVDAIPDLSENQVIVFADWTGRSPQDIEEQVTHPLSVQLQGLAGVKTVRASSEFNFSMINVIFDDRTDPYFARQRVLERLTIAKAALPVGVTPTLAPDATALGQIFWYTVEGDGMSLDALRAVEDFNVRYALSAVPGVAEVASAGGFVREYHVDIDPEKLRVFNLPLSAVYSAVAASNLSVGGKVLLGNNSESVLRGVGWLRGGEAGVKDLEDLPVVSREGVAVRVKDVAAVQLGPAFRRSALEKDGHEAVGGVVVMRLGQNPLAVISAVKEKIRAIQSGLPAGVRVVPFYDRTRLIESAIHTVTGTLREEMLIASIAILLILTHLRSAVVVCLTLPMAVLVSFLFMYYLDLPSNIMSLCGIAISIGILVDASVVMVENATHQLKARFGDRPVTGDTTETVVAACRLVGGPIFFSVVIMLVSFLPVFAFGGQEGKLSHPLAFTKSFAMVGVSLLSITLVPALIPLLIRGRLSSEDQNLIVRNFIAIYKPVLSWAIDRPAFVWWLTATIVLVGAGFIGNAVVTAMCLALGLLAVILAVKRDGWTFWALAALVAAVFIARGAPSTSARLALPWLVPALAAGLILLALALKHWRTAAVASLLVTSFVATARFPRLGGEFMPELDEGAIMDMPITAPRVAMSEAVDDVMVRDRVLRSMPEVETVVGKIGRAETATDPSPVDMVETMVELRPRGAWPQRKLKFPDALERAAAAASAMQRRHWLAGPTLDEQGWLDAARASEDQDALRRRPDLVSAADVLDRAAQASEERFDRAMRELASRRETEYEPEVARQLVGLAFTDLINHAAGLPPRGGTPALRRAPDDADWKGAAAAAAEHGRLLAPMPRQEEVDALLAALRSQAVARGILADRDDLLLDEPTALMSLARTVKRAVGGSTPSFAERVFADIQAAHHHLWADRVATLNWELHDVGARMLEDFLVEEIASAAKGTSWLGRPPTKAEASSLAAELSAASGKGLLLWHKTRGDLVAEMNAELQMPGWGNIWTQPIINRVNMLATGVRTQIGVKVFAPVGKPLAGVDKPLAGGGKGSGASDAGNEAGAIADVQRISEQVAARLRTIPGAVDVQADQATGKRYLEVRIDRVKAARYGVSAADVGEAVETALGGAAVTSTVEGTERFTVQLRLNPAAWQDPAAIGDVPILANTTATAMLDLSQPQRSSPPGAAGASGRRGAVGSMGTDGRAGSMLRPGLAGPSGSMGQPRPAVGGSGSEIPSASIPGAMALVPLRTVADISVVEGPSMIKSENGRVRNYVTLNVRGRDVVGFVEEAQAAVAPIEKGLAGTGMTIEWTGEFENQVHARQTLTVIFPVVVLLIALLLYATFRNAADVGLVMLAVVGALAGAVTFQALFGFNFSVIVSIGYIAAFGMATQTGVIMLVYLRDALARRGGTEGLAATDGSASLKGIPSLAALRRAVIDGAVHRLRPKLLTEGVAIVGLVPMLWAAGTGSEIMRPMAAPVLGGLLISDEVIDLMIPVLFYWVRRRQWLALHPQREEISEAEAGKREVLVEV